MDPMELEHVIGFQGTQSNVLCCHPREPDVVLQATGCNVVVQNWRDDHDQHFLQGHDEPVTALAVSKHGVLAASGQAGSRTTAVPESKVICWDLSQRVDVYHLRGMRGGVACLAFSPDEQFLAGSGADGSLLVWDMQTGEVVASQGGNLVATSLVWGAPTRSAQANASSSRPNYALFATVGPEVGAYFLRYSVASMHYQMEKQAFRLPAGLIRQYTDSCLSPCGSALLVCTSVGDVSAYNVDALVYRSAFPVSSGGARAIHSAGRFVFVGGGDGTLKRLAGHGADWALDAELRLEGAVTSISHVAEVGAGAGAGEGGAPPRLLVGTAAGRVYEVSGDMRVARCVEAETCEVVDVAFARDSSIRFATLSAAGALKVWDLSDYSVVTRAAPRARDSRDAGLCLAFDGHDDELVVGFASGAVRAFAAGRGKPGEPGAGTESTEPAWEIAVAHRDGVSALCASPLYYATGGRAGGVRLWARQSRTQLFEFGDHVSRAVTGLCADAKMTHLLHSCGADRNVFTYDLKKERRMAQHQWGGGGGGGGGGSCGGGGGGGRGGASGGGGSHGGSSHGGSGGNGSFTSLTQRLDQDGELVTSGTDGRLLTWDMDVEGPVSQVEVSSRGVGFSCVAVSPGSGRFVAASATDAHVRVWDLQSGALVATSPVNGFVDIVRITWSPDEKQIVSVGRDACICVWNFYAEALSFVDEAKTHHK